MDLRGLYRYIRKLRQDNAYRRHIPRGIKEKFHISFKDGKIVLKKKEEHERRQREIL
jgi:hypothetical protein